MKNVNHVDLSVHLVLHMILVLYVLDPKVKLILEKLVLNVSVLKIITH